MQIFRPFISIKKSVQCLNSKDLYVSGCINCNLIIDAIFNKLNIVKTYKLDWIYDTDLFHYYYNNGEPFIKELMLYRNLSFEEVKKWEGIPKDPKDNIFNVFLKNKKKFNKTSNWDKDNARYHKLILLYRNFFWYKRFLPYYRNNFVEEDIKKFLSSDFVDGRPNTISFKELKEHQNEKD